MRLAVVTVGRSDFGIYEPLLKGAIAHPEVDMSLLVSGMHLAPEFGMTVADIERSGYPVRHRIEMLVSSDTPEGTAKSMGVGILGFSQIFASDRPDWLVVLGDRFEMFSAAAAALPFRIPIAHLHGGELTFGAIDEAMRHSITKMSHMHFASTAEYASRIVQLGEEPWRVTHCGALSLEHIDDSVGAAELKSRFGVCIDPPPLVVTFHPVTLQWEQALAQLDELLAALEEFDHPCVITLPNADASGRAVTARISKFALQNPSLVTIVENFGRAGYFGMLRHASAVVGNSSSGILEAGTFHLPVINIGDRQAGRTKGGNVVDVPPNRSDILAALRLCTSTAYRAGCRGLINPYAPPVGVLPSEVILERLLECPINETLLMKKFHDVRGGGDKI